MNNKNNINFGLILDSSGNETVSEEKKLEIMREIEEKTEKKIINATKTGIIESPKKMIRNVRRNPESLQSTLNTLEDIMKQGADEFKEKVGRNMTYSEMRAMYG